MEKKVALQIRSYEPWKETAKCMSEIGFKYVAIVLGEEKMKSNDWKQQVEDMRETFERYNLKCIQTHAPYYNLLLSAEKRDPDMERALFRCMEATKILGAEICAVHPRSYIVSGEPREIAVDREKSLAENLLSFQPLAEECEKQSILFGIENLMRYPNAHPYFYSWIVEDHIEIIDRLNSKNVCAVWDFGHANLVDTDHAERICKLGNRIKGTHVHNNDGVEDNHYPPFIPNADEYFVRRSVDWNSVLSALRSTGFDGYLTLETCINYKYPIAGYIRYLYDSICALNDILKG